MNYGMYGVLWVMLSVFLKVKSTPNVEVRTCARTDSSFTMCVELVDGTPITDVDVVHCETRWTNINCDAPELNYHYDLTMTIFGEALLRFSPLYPAENLNISIDITGSDFFGTHSFIACALPRHPSYVEAHRKGNGKQFKIEIGSDFFYYDYQITVIDYKKGTTVSVLIHTCDSATCDNAPTIEVPEFLTQYLVQVKGVSYCLSEFLESVESTDVMIESGIDWMVIASSLSGALIGLVLIIVMSWFLLKLLRKRVD